ncbi:MAG: MFS transporter [Anaerolineales bacterium]|nr:MFS transporter [Anaerolineales bacterium]
MDNQKRNRLLAVLFVGVLMAALDIAIVGPALPTIRNYFNVDDRAVTWLFTTYVFFNLIGTPLMAKLSDLWGRRSVYLADIILFALGSLIVASAPSFAIVLLGRAIQGLGSGGIFPVASAVIGDTFPPEKRGGALGLIGAVFGLAFIVGPIIGGLLLLAHWRWLFAINLPIALAVLLVAPPLLPNIPLQNRRPFDWTGMWVLALMLSFLTYGLTQINTAHFWASVTGLRVWPSLALALLLLPLFIFLERRAADPVLDLRLFASRQLSLASLLSFGAGLGESGVIFIPALAVAAFAVSDSNASFLLMPVVLALAVGAPVSGRMLDKVGSKVVIMSGASLLTIGILLLSFFPQSWIIFFSAGVLMGLGLSALLGAPIRYIMLNEAPAEERAAAQALITIFTGVGQLTSGALVGAIAASFGGGVTGYSSAYGVLGLVTLVMILLAAGLKSRAAELATIAQSAVTPPAVQHPDKITELASPSISGKL